VVEVLGAMIGELARVLRVSARLYVKSLHLNLRFSDEQV